MSTTIKHLSKEIIRYKLSEYLSAKGLSQFSQTSWSLFKACRPILDQRAAKALLLHVVLGEEEQAKAMIAANPRLLLMKSQAVDYSGRTIIATVFQAALGAEDKDMWEMMKPYFKKLEEQSVIESAKETMKAQFDAQFPNGYEDVSAADLKDIYNNLAQAIIDGNGNKAIEDFRKFITQRDVIESGKHFNMQHLIAAYQSYNENFYRFANWDNRKKFWIEVIGYVQRQMPTYYAQVYCSGIQLVNEKPASFKRTLNLGPDGEFFPLSVDSGDSGLGFYFSVYSYYVSFSCPHALVDGGAVKPLQSVKKLCETKTVDLRKLESILGTDEHSQSYCVIL